MKSSSKHRNVDKSQDRFARLRLGFGVAAIPVLGLLAWGCGSGGHISNTRDALYNDEVLGIAKPGDPTQVQDMETVPRDQFAAALNADALAYPSADAKTKAAVNRGLALFTADRRKVSDGQGPYFNQVNCLGCHMAPGQGVNGRALTLAPVTRSLTKDAFLIFGEYNPTDGTFIDPASEGGPVFQKRELPGYPNESIPPPVGLPFQRSVGLRAAPAYIGRGLMEAIYDADIIANKDPNLNGLIDVNGNQIYGFENRNSAAAGGLVGGDSVNRLARFGLRAQGPTILQFALGNSPIGLSSPFTPGANHPSNKPDTHPSYDLTADNLRDWRIMLRMMAPPARVPITPGSVEDRGRVLFGMDLSHVADPTPTPEQKRGMLPVAQRDMTKGALNCVGCHMPVSVTGTSPSNLGGNVLSNRRAYIFSDLLIHNLGKGLATGSLDVASYVADANNPLPGQDPTQHTAADFGLQDYGKTPNFPIDDNTLPAQGRATPFQYRTATLMGLTLCGPPFFHDARISSAQTIESALDQAIRYHAAPSLTIPTSVGELDPQSEAYWAVRNYLALPQSDKDALIAFLKTL